MITSRYIFFFFLFIAFQISSSPVSVTSGGTGVSGTIATYGLLAAGTDSVTPIQTITPGTSGQILTSNGAGAYPSWTKNNGFILLKVVTLSNSANVIFTASDLDPAFTVFMVVLEGFDPAGIGVLLRGNFSSNNGSSYLATGYSSGIGTMTYNSTTITNLNSTTFLQLGSASSGQHSATFFLFGLNGNFAPSTGPVVLGWGFPAFSPTLYGMLIASISGSPNINNIRIAESSGNILTGFAFLYGLVT